MKYVLQRNRSWVTWMGQRTSVVAVPVEPNLYRRNLLWTPTIGFGWVDLRWNVRPACSCHQWATNRTTTITTAAPPTATLMNKIWGSCRTRFTAWTTLTVVVINSSRHAEEILLHQSILPRTASKTGYPMAISFSTSCGKCKLKSDMTANSCLLDFSRGTAVILSNGTLDISSKSYIEILNRIPLKIYLFTCVYIYTWVRESWEINPLISPSHEYGSGGRGSIRESRERYH